MASFTDQEDKIFKSLKQLGNELGDSFDGKLCRDGVPQLEVYRQQPAQVLFVFREPNMGGKPHDLDQPAQVRHLEFGKTTVKRGWWDEKIPGFGHAVSHALAGDSSYATFRTLMGPEQRQKRTEECLFPFAFVNIKKIGGNGTADAEGVKRHARDYHQCLEDQLKLYKPHLVIGCGRGGASPAQLLNKYVLPGGDQRRTGSPRAEQAKGRDGYKWWQFSKVDGPLAMLEFNHPSAILKPETQYDALAAAVREIALKVGLVSADDQKATA